MVAIENRTQAKQKSPLTCHRARFYDPEQGRFLTLDPHAGNVQAPQSPHKYLYTHGNPVMGVDPTGMFEATVAGVSVSISIGSFVSGSAASYGFGKALTAGYLLATENSLENFRLFEWMDLANLIPGGVLASAFSKITILPARLLTNVGGKVVGRYFGTGLSAVAGAFRQTFGGKLAMFAADGTEVVLEEGTSRFGFVHILQRHVAQFWDGTKTSVTTFFPSGTTPGVVLGLLGEAIAKADVAALRRLGASGGPVAQSILLDDGLVVKLATQYENGVFKVISFFAESGPGVTKAADVIKHVN